MSGRPLILGGVTIPHDKGLEGHSDADVLIHAICDSLLGAAALGDIGKHFPNTDERYKGISSLVLLKQVGGLLVHNKFIIVNVDCTVVLERPMILPFAGEMQQNIASSLNVDISQVSVKATTCEGMGFVGREEGAKAYAVAIIVPT